MKNLSLICLAGLTFTAVFGTLLHFVYGFTGNIAFAPISAVNESTWEHMKILFFPMLAFALLQAKFHAKSVKSFWQIKFYGISFGLLLVPVLFYTLNGMFGDYPDWINIGIFFLSAFLAYLLEYFLFKKDYQARLPAFIAVGELVLIGLAFAVFTFIPPHLPLFQDPVYGGYGIQNINGKTLR